MFPSICPRPVNFLGGNGHRPDDWFWMGRSVVRFLPPKSHNTFCPPICHFPIGGPFWGLRDPKLLHTFYCLGINFQLHRTSVTQGFLPGILLCTLGAFIRYFLRPRQLHTSIAWELIFQLHAHLLPSAREKLQDRKNAFCVYLISCNCYMTGKKIPRFLFFM